MASSVFHPSFEMRDEREGVVVWARRGRSLGRKGVRRRFGGTKASNAG